jgi:extracellular elastinolytic metalloproteinase
MHRTALVLFLGLLGLPLSAQSPASWLEITRDHLLRQGVAPADVATLEPSDQYTSAHNGVTHLYLQQRHRGIRLEGTQVSAHYAADGQLLRLHQQLEAKLVTRCPAPTPTLSPAAALWQAMGHLGQWEQALPPRLSSPQGPEQACRFAGGNLSSEDIPLRLAYLPQSEGEIRLAWYLRIYPPDHQHWWNLWVDAQTGQILAEDDWVLSCAPEAASVAHLCPPSAASPSSDPLRTPLDGSRYRVFAEPVESPSHGNQSLVLTPADSLASPFGWHDIDGQAGAEFTYLRGNNVWSRMDREGTNNPNGYSPDGGLGLDFDFLFDSTQSLTSLGTQNAALTNLFYWNNLMHDVWYHKGFTEAAGNFQANNYGRGGQGGDFVIAEAQDGIGLNNANFATPPDGFSGRMQMFLWNRALRNGLTIGGSSPAAGTYDVAPFSLAQPLPDTPLMAPIALIQDPGNTTEGCAPPLNTAEVAGSLVLIDRGDCYFNDKALTAQEAGAVGVLLVNNVPGPIFGLGNRDTRVEIPMVMISQANGNLIKASLSQGLIGSLMDTKVVGGYDSDFDNGVIAHEYAHGISIRLTGGPSTNCLFGEEQAGEGWSDWFALVMTHRPGDQGSDPRGIGTYVQGQSPQGPGIRRFPYTTDMSLNPATYDDIRLASVSVPHGVGSVMCTMLWDLYWALVERYGYDPDLIGGAGGNHIAMQLVMDGLKLQPCTPGFVDVRDAILLADEINYGGANRCLIWQAFARRGLGYSAEQGSSSSRQDNHEAFDLPPLCQDILYLAKTTEDHFVRPGDTLRYSFVVSNRSGQTLTGLRVRDTLPALLSYLSASSSCPVDVEAAGLSLLLDDILDEELDTCTLLVQVDPAAPVSRYLSQDSLTGDRGGYAVNSVVGSDGWTLVEGAGRRGTPAYFVPNRGAENDQRLTLPALSVDSNTVFTFWQQYHTEAGWDGGLVEYRVTGDSLWQDLGPLFVRRGYNSAVSFNNPAGARASFGGNSNGYFQTWADLGTLAGQEVEIRFRFVSDNNTFETGWYLDEFGVLAAEAIVNQACVEAAQGNRYCAIQPQASYLIGENLLTSAPTTTVSSAGNLHVYPNPADEAITVVLQNWRPGSMQVRLLDGLGRQIWQRRVAGKKVRELTIPLAALPAGIYLLQVQQGSRRLSERVQVR